MARLYKKTEGKIQYTASTQVSIPLARNYHIQHLLFKLNVKHTNSTAVFKDSLANLINRVEIVANGNEVIKSIPGFKLQLNSLLISGIRGLNTVVTADGADKESFEYFVVPFAMPRMVRPNDTILNSALFNTFDLRVNWGDSASLGTGITVTDASIDVMSESLVNYRRSENETIKHFIETSLNKEITSSTSEFQIDLPTQKLYKSLAIISTVNGVRTNTVVNNIKIKSGTTVFADFPAEALRAENLGNFRPNTQADFDGVHILDFTTRGKLSDVLNTLSNSGFNTVELILDVTKQTGTNNILLLQETIQDTGLVEKY